MFINGGRFPSFFHAQYMLCVWETNVMLFFSFSATNDVFFMKTVLFFIFANLFYSFFATLHHFQKNT